jgi:hypothetical protein
MPKNPKKTTHPDCLGISVQWKDYFFLIGTNYSKCEIRDSSSILYFWKRCHWSYGIIENLKKRVRRVQKILLLDGFGSFHFLKELVEELTESGVHFAFFFLFQQTLYIGRRWHHKVGCRCTCTFGIGEINTLQINMMSPEKNPGWLRSSDRWFVIKPKKLQLLLS